MFKSYLCFLLILILLITSCSSFYRESNEIGIVFNEIIRSYSQIMKKQGLNPIMSGGKIGDDGIDKISLHFCCARKIGIEEGRKLIISCGMGLINYINQHENYSNFLKKRYVDVKDIKIIIVFCESNNRPVLPPYIGLISLINGEVDYSFYNIENKSDDTFKIEDYYEAVDLVKRDCG